MTDTQTGAADQAAQRLTVYLYGLYLLGLLVVFPAIIGAILNYRQRNRVAGTRFESHFDWQLRTFWWMLGWCITGGVLMLVGSSGALPVAGPIGAVILLVAICWFLFRLLKGYLYLVEGRGVPNVAPVGDGGRRSR